MVEAVQKLLEKYDVAPKPFEQVYALTLFCAIGRAFQLKH